MSCEICTSRTGPFTFLMMDLFGSSRNSTLTCVTLPVLPVRPSTLLTFASFTGWSFKQIKVVENYLMVGCISVRPKRLWTSRHNCMRRNINKKSEAYHCAEFWVTLSVIVFTSKPRYYIDIIDNVQLYREADTKHRSHTKPENLSPTPPDPTQVRARTRTVAYIV